MKRMLSYPARVNDAQPQAAILDASGGRLPTQQSPLNTHRREKDMHALFFRRSKNKHMAVETKEKGKNRKKKDKKSRSIDCAGFCSTGVPALQVACTLLRKPMGVEPRHRMFRRTIYADPVDHTSVCPTHVHVRQFGILIYTLLVHLQPQALTSSHPRPPADVEHPHHEVLYPSRHNDTTFRTSTRQCRSRIHSVAPSQRQNIRFLVSLLTRLSPAGLIPPPQRAGGPSIRRRQVRSGSAGTDLSPLQDAPQPQDSNGPNINSLGPRQHELTEPM